MRQLFPIILPKNDPVGKDFYTAAKEAYEDIRSIFNMPNAEAEYIPRKTVEKYAGRDSEFVKWLEYEIPEGSTAL